ncbi:hypothetical protein ACS0TY_027828 [Phlomoides rotata]
MMIHYQRRQSLSTSRLKLKPNPQTGRYQTTNNKPRENPAQHTPQTRGDNQNYGNATRTLYEQKQEQKTAAMRRCEESEREDQNWKQRTLCKTSRCPISGEKTLL